MKQKKRNLAIFGMISLLYVLSIFAILVRSAFDIQTTMQAETEQICADAAAKVKDMGAEEDAEKSRGEQIFRYQKAMADNPMSLSASYPFYCVSALGGNAKGWEMPVYSRNVIFLTVTWLEGTEEQIPMVFAHENSADVAQILLHPEQVRLAAANGELEIWGYWQDDYFYVQKMDYGWMSYQSPVDAPEEVKLERVCVVCAQRAGQYGRRNHKEVNALKCDVEVSMKTYGRDNQFAAFVSAWEADDALVQELYIKGFTMEGAGWARPDLQSNIENRTIFQTKIMFRQRMRDYSKLFDGNYMYVAYLVKFSPIALAARQLWSSGLPLLLLGMFVLSGLFLSTVYTQTRHQELRAYRDEIARQTQALEYARDAEKSRREMTSAIAHELKTPIAVLSSYAEALQENIDAEKQSHYLSVIREETGKMDRMVLELLDLSRLEAGRYKLKRESFDLENLAKEIIAPLQKAMDEKQLSLVWQVGDPMVNADRYRLGQVVENFMTNAIRHTPEGGKIVLRIGVESETFSVENQGKPIPAEQLPKVWETFWQGDSSRNERGSGLGLAICRTIVTLHGGSCKAENTAAGVRFSISLSAEKKLYQLGRIPQEETVKLDYPIARWYTTVERVLGRLELVSGRALPRELKAGNIRVGDEPVTDRRTKLYAGYVLSWKEFRITIRQDDGEKRRALLMDRMRPGSLGYQDGMKPAGWVGNPK